MNAVTFTPPSAENWVSEKCRLCGKAMSPEDSTAHPVTDKVLHIFHTHCLHNSAAVHPNCPGCNWRVISINGVAVQHSENEEPELNKKLTFEDFQRLANIHLETVDAEDVFNIQFKDVTFKEFLESFDHLYSACKRGELLAVSQWLLHEHSSCRGYCTRESLVVAAKYGRTEVVEILLEEGAIPPLWCIRALDFATENEHIQVSQLLVKHIDAQRSRISIVKMVAAIALAGVACIFSQRYIWE